MYATPSNGPEPIAGRCLDELQRHRAGRAGRHRELFARDLAALADAPRSVLVVLADRLAARVLERRVGRNERPFGEHCSSLLWAALVRELADAFQGHDGFVAVGRGNGCGTSGSAIEAALAAKAQHSRAAAMGSQLHLETPSSSAVKCPRVGHLRHNGQGGEWMQPRAGRRQSSQRSVGCETLPTPFRELAPTPQLVFIHGPGAGACGDAYHYQLEHFPGAWRRICPAISKARAVRMWRAIRNGCGAGCRRQGLDKDLVLVGYTLGASIRAFGPGSTIRTK